MIVALFELNTPEFTMMLSVLPKSFQVQYDPHWSVCLSVCPRVISLPVVLSTYLL